MHATVREGGQGSPPGVKEWHEEMKENAVESRKVLIWP